MDKKDFIKWVRKIGLDYQPNAQVRERLAGVELVAVVGPTGAGKTTLMGRMNLPIIKSDVTRNRRAEDQKDKTNNYKSDYLKILEDLKAGNYAQFVVSSSDEFYGTHTDSYPESGPCTMAIIAGAIPTFRALGFKKITQLYIVPPGYVEWMRRIGVQRSSDIDHRMKEAFTSFKLALSDDNYVFILNDDIEQALADIQTVLRGKEIAARRSELARNTVGILLKRLGDQDTEL